MLSTALLFLSPSGLPSLSKQRKELRDCQMELLQKHQRNRELLEEVHRLSAKDPELFEALARRQGYARPGETVFTFRDRGESR